MVGWFFFLTSQLTMAFCSQFGGNGIPMSNDTSYTWIGLGGVEYAKIGIIYHYNRNDDYF